MKRILIVAALVVIGLGINSYCKNDSGSNSDSATGKENLEMAKPQNIPIEKISGTPTQSELEKEVARNRGGNFMESARVSGNRVFITVNMPAGKKDSYLMYFNSDQSIKKSANQMTAAILRKFPDINQVNYQIVVMGSKYQIMVNRMEFVEFMGYNFESLDKDWSSNVNDQIVYDDEGRERYFKKFGTVN